MPKDKSNSRFSDLSVKKIELPGVKSFPPVRHKILPQHPFGLQMSAAKGSGKTNLVLNFVSEDKFYKGYFHRIIIFSPTVKTDDKWYAVLKMKHILSENKVKERILEDIISPKQKHAVGKVVYKSEEDMWKKLKKREEPAFDGKIQHSDIHEEPFTMEAFAKVYNEIYDEVRLIESTLKKQGRDDFNARYYADRILILIDDQVGTDVGKVGNRNNPLVQFATRHRHLSCSFIGIAQFFKGFSPGVRTQCNAFIGFELGNDDEQHKIYETLKAGAPWKDWKKLYDFATEEPFDFFYFNNHFPRGSRAFKNFDYVLRIQAKGPNGKTSKVEEEHVSSRAMLTSHKGY